MSLNRQALGYLSSWKSDGNRKPLLVRGARQVGKTTLIREFANEFDRFIELNLEKRDDRELFDVENIDQLINAIFLAKKVTSKEGSFLLFVDEIQESPKAIQQLRYLYEERPDIHVIAAGSLLEFALRSVPSFPVGRIDYLYLYPMNFVEFLHAFEEVQALEVLSQIPIPEYAHDILLKSFHTYFILGGMPEVVAAYHKHQDFSKLNRIYNRIWKAYQDDVEKYAANDTERKVIRHVIKTVPQAPDRIKMEGFGNSNYRSREVGEALNALDLARVIRLIYPTTGTKPPIVLDFKKRPRLQMLDVGLMNHALSLQGEMLGMNDLSDYYKGSIVHQIVTQELTSMQEDVDFKPSFWIREKKQSDAEVDLVYQLENKVIPVEIKAGKQGTLRSLHQFVEAADHPYAVRMYAGKFSVEEHVTPIKRKPYLLMNLPYYLGTQIPKYLEYFVANYQLKSPKM